jgi:hypothetical protein
MKKRKHKDKPKPINTMDIKKLIAEFKKIKGAKFIGFPYENKQGEVSKRIVNGGVSYANAVKKDIEKLNKAKRKKGKGYVKGEGYTQADWTLAIESKLESLKSPDTTRSNGQKDAYVNITTNGIIRWNVATQKIYIFAQSVSKSVTQEGEYKEVKSKPLTLAKRSVEKHLGLSTSKFRLFVLDGLRGDLKLNGDTVELE